MNLDPNLPVGRRAGPFRHAETLHLRWKRRVARTIDHAAVLERVDDDAGLSGHYVFMIIVSAGIAVLGLLLSSPAVVIGAMLISPMMGPIIGLGFGLALFDNRRILVSAGSLAAGILIAVAFCALITLLSPLQTVTTEIAARTRPNLFDLGVAILSGAAGSYAMIRGRHGAIVGVAIAVAVMPPLATVGFGLASLNKSIVLGAAFLFVTNLTAISLTAAVFARLYGFAHQLSPHQSWAQVVLIVSGLVALAIPLALALRQIAWESVASRTIRDAIAERFGDGAKVGSVDIDYDGHPLEVDAVVFTPREIRGAERQLANRLKAEFSRPVSVRIEQVRLGGVEAESDELAAARGTLAARQAQEVAERLALAAGVDPVDVFLDRSRREARASAVPLPGADLDAYRQLESRVAAASPGWTIVLVPPLLPLGDVVLPTTEASPEERQAALSPVIWAQRRLGLQLVLSGRGAEPWIEELQRQGVPVSAGRATGRLNVSWADPNERNERTSE